MAFLVTPWRVHVYIWSFISLIPPPYNSATLNCLIFFPWSHSKPFPSRLEAGDLIVLEQFKLITNLWAKQAPGAELKNRSWAQLIAFPKPPLPAIKYPQGPT